MSVNPVSIHSPLAMPCAADGIDDFLSQPSAGDTTCLANQPGPFLVLGAGGKMGLHLCLMLRKALNLLGRKEPIFAVSRFGTLRDTDDFTRHGIETIACDLTEPTAVARLPDAQTVFFLAGGKFGTATTPGLLQKMNVEMPRLIAMRFSRARIVVFSSGCVYPFVSPETGGATEETPVQPIGEYAASCVAREKAFEAISVSQGTPITLIRLNYSVEFRYGLLLDIAQNVRNGVPVNLAMSHVNVIWQQDAVSHVIQSLALTDTPPVPLNITGPDILSVRQLALGFENLLGRPATFTGSESGTAWLNNARRSHASFGRPPTNIDQMMHWVAAWLDSGGNTWGKPTGFDRRDGKF